MKFLKMIYAIQVARLESQDTFGNYAILYGFL
ncbi:Hypothetical protein EHLA_0852 [Anaerobutyricum hallii]|uniref:Uncharacterized protein n=1 Tax=Anaerobutyricum hallii TaxID=39488 RepID=A0A285PUW1_9FIRM|nr:Hypothetical protein EHLA_0852 [Anaerobutyricum hallii]